jgi:preprotein translocase subunit Sec61beta
MAHARRQRLVEAGFWNQESGFKKTTAWRIFATDVAGNMVMAEPKKASVLQVIKAVFWSFFGIRRKQDYDADAVSLTPVQVVVAGIIGAALLVASLLLLVRFIMSHAA